MVEPPTRKNMRTVKLDPFPTFSGWKFAKNLGVATTQVVFTASGDDPPRWRTAPFTAPWPIFPVLQAPTEWLDWLYFLEVQAVVGFCWVASKTMVASSSYCWWKKSCHQLIGSSSHYLQGFLHSRWLFAISSINSIMATYTVYFFISSGL